MVNFLSKIEQIFLKEYVAMKKSMSMLDLFWYVCPMFFATQPVLCLKKDEDSDWGQFVELD
jgi:hypothetical protein